MEKALKPESGTKRYIVKRKDSRGQGFKDSSEG
jgi:hypothetical protein